MKHHDPWDNTPALPGQGGWKIEDGKKLRARGVAVNSAVTGRRRRSDDRLEQHLAKWERLLNYLEAR